MVKAHVVTKTKAVKTAVSATVLLFVGPFFEPEVVCSSACYPSEATSAACPRADI